MLQIVVHCIERDRVTIGTWISQDGTVVTDEHEVNTPGVNTNRRDLQSALSHLTQATDDFEIKCIDVPIIMTTLFDKVIREAGHFL